MTASVSAPWPSGSVVLLTGGASGLGRALLDELLRQGATVHLLLHPRHQGTALHADLAQVVASITFCDLGDLDATSAAAKSVVEQVERLNALVLCAATASYGAIDRVPWTDFRDVANVNYLANVVLVGACLTRLREQPAAWIIGVGSGSALVGLRFGSPYNASKSALHSFFESLTAECYGSNVRVLHVMPGYMATPFHTKQRIHGAGRVPPTGKPADIGSIARAIIARARTRQGNALLGRNPFIAYQLRYWWPRLLRRLLRREGY